MFWPVSPGAQQGSDVCALLPIAGKAATCQLVTLPSPVPRCLSNKGWKERKTHFSDPSLPSLSSIYVFLIFKIKYF